MNNKTVFILGAGFSKYTEYPLQNEILQELVNFYKRTNITKESKSNWDIVNIFFNKCIGSKIETFYIEDLFTILDKCLIDEEFFKSYDTARIEEVKTALISSIRDYFNQITKEKMEDHNKNLKYKELKEFSDLILSRREKNKTEDKLSIISLNWDCLLERFLQYYSVNYENISLDYCTYDYSFNNKGSIPSILKKANKINNLKILKAHGSTNWGYCQNCKRLYISFGKKMNSKDGESDKKFECIRYCNKIYKRINLNPVIITPTFLKDIGNFHLQNIWSNMGIELSEANKIVIIGYSLRAEDFYFRFLLSKYVRSNCSIHIFDYEPLTTNKSKAIIAIKQKYEKFFQQLNPNNISVNVNGWTNSLNEIKKILELP
jgi:hypothetical protein